LVILSVKGFRMNEQYPENLIDRVVNLHINILKSILIGKTFEEIKQIYLSKIDELNYEEIIINKAKRLTFNENGELIGAYPVSPIKNNFKVHVEGIGTGYSMCALDALGIPYTFNAKTTIETMDSADNKPLKIVIDPKNPQSEDFPFVVTYNKGYKSIHDLVASNAQLAVDACPSILFYSEERLPRKDLFEILNFSDALLASKELFSPEGFKKHIKEILKQK
jgi:hypothetical protein